MDKIIDLKTIDSTPPKKKKKQKNIFASYLLALGKVIIQPALIKSIE